ncbi:MAG: C39 family peptidase [Dissulfuribacterales bacterium]
MHILAAFVIVACLLAGFHPIIPMRDNEIYIDVGGSATDVGAAGTNVSAAGTPVVIKNQIMPLNELQFSYITKQAYDYSCGSAALATLLNSYLGENFSERQVIQGLMEYGNKKKIAERRAFSLLDMKQFVQKLGYDGNGYKADMKDLTELDVPCIIPIEFLGYRHFTILRGFHGNHIFLADPFRGNASYTISTFEKMWYQNVIFIVDKKNGPTISALKLTNKDLLYIDENTTLDILTDYGPEIPMPDEQKNNFTLPDEYQKYDRP